MCVRLVIAALCYLVANALVGCANHRTSERVSAPTPAPTREATGNVPGSDMLPVHFVTDVVARSEDAKVYHFQVGGPTAPLRSSEGRSFDLADVKIHFTAQRDRGTPLIHVHLSLWDREKVSVRELVRAVRTIREAAAASEMQDRVHVFVWAGN
jgi:hypothetical protein